MIVRVDALPILTIPFLVPIAYFVWKMGEMKSAYDKLSKSSRIVVNGVLWFVGTILFGCLTFPVTFHIVFGLLIAIPAAVACQLVELEGAAPAQNKSSQETTIT